MAEIQSDTRSLALATILSCGRLLPTHARDQFLAGMRDLLDSHRTEILWWERQAGQLIEDGDRLRTKARGWERVAKAWQRIAGRLRAVKEGRHDA